MGLCFVAGILKNMWYENWVTSEQVLERSRPAKSKVTVGNLFAGEDSCWLSLLKLCMIHKTEGIMKG